MSFLRPAARTPSFNAPLDGDVEVDETYTGGKAKNMHASDRKTGKQHRNKKAILGVKKRDGELRMMHIPNTTNEVIHGAVRENVSHQARLITDHAQYYKGLTGEYNHESVNHGAGEYVRDDVHTNNIESAWALLKRQIIGIHHWYPPSTYSVMLTK